MAKFDRGLVCKKHESEKYMDTHTNTFDSYFVYMNMKMAVAQHMKLE